jgi:DNA-directed RNA polymerase subunit RPC12/RpoP/regulator of extracellular matrix RemA (YlzA/DUF370 family)
MKFFSIKFPFHNKNRIDFGLIIITLSLLLIISQNCDAMKRQIQDISKLSSQATALKLKDVINISEEDPENDSIKKQLIELEKTKQIYKAAPLYKCKCGDTFFRKGKLKQHMKSHKETICPHCNKSFKKNLNAHITRMHSPKQSDQNNSASTAVSTVATAIVSPNSAPITKVNNILVNPVNPYLCLRCSDIISDRDSLLLHIENKHKK